MQWTTERGGGEKWHMVVVKGFWIYVLVTVGLMGVTLGGRGGCGVEGGFEEDCEGSVGGGPIRTKMPELYKLMGWSMVRKMPPIV